MRFAWDALHTLDMRVSHSGFTPFHLAVVKGNMQVLKFLVRMYRCRDYYRESFQQGKYHHRKAECSLQQVKELPAGTQKLAPLLLSIEAKEYEMFIYLLFELKCDLNTVDSRKNNALHIAVQAENLNAIKKLVFLDSDAGIMRAAKNAQGQTPVELGEPELTDYLVTIWDRVKQGNLHKIRELVQQTTFNLITNVQINRRSAEYHINMQTHTLKNTPLHIALANG